MKKLISLLVCIMVFCSSIVFALDIETVESFVNKKVSFYAVALFEEDIQVVGLVVCLVKEGKDTVMYIQCPTTLKLTRIYIDNIKLIMEILENKEDKMNKKEMNKIIVELKKENKELEARIKDIIGDSGCLPIDY